MTSEPAPTLHPSPFGSHSGSSWLQACPRSRTNIHTPPRAASLSPSLPSLIPLAASALRRSGSPERGAHRHQRRPEPSRLAPALPHGTRRSPLASVPGRPPDAPPAQGEDELDRRDTSRNSTFYKHCLRLCGWVCVERGENKLMPRVQPPLFCLHPPTPPRPLPSHTRAHTGHWGRVSALRPRAGMGVFISEGGRARGGAC